MADSRGGGAPRGRDGGVPHVLQPVAGRWTAPPQAAHTHAGADKTIVGTFASDAYFREAIGQQYLHRGRDELTSFFSMCFSAGGGISLEGCAVTDDGVR